MASDPSKDMQHVWQEQPADSPQFLPVELRRHAHRLQTTIKWRNLREYAGAIIVAAVFGYYIFRFPTPLMRAGSTLSIVAALIVAWQIRKRGSGRDLPADLALSSCLEFHLRELERQRVLLCHVWRWYLLPWVPGLALFLIGLGFEQLHGQWLPVAVVAAICAIAFVGVARMNHSASCVLVRQIEELKALRKEE